MRSPIPRTVRRSVVDGFTVIELLVALTIMLIVIGLLMPSLQASREAARRVKCANHLHQLGLALHRYHNVHGSLPAGIAKRTGMFWSGAILPYVEKGSIHEKIDSEQPWITGINADMLRVRVNVFRCPSAAVPETMTHGIEGRIPATYLGCVSGTENRETGPEHRLFRRVQNGVLFRNSRTKLAHVVDGTSHTIMVGETLIDPSAIRPDYSGVKQFVDHWAIATTEFGQNEVSEALGSTAAPIGMSLSDDDSMFPDDQELSFSSHHPAGTQFVFCDGHVSLLSHSIGLELYRALGTRNSQECVDVSGY